MLPESWSHSNLQSEQYEPELMSTHTSFVHLQHLYFFGFICTSVALVSSYCFQLLTLVRMSYCFSAVEGVLWVYGSSVQQPYQVCSQFGHKHIHTYCQLTRIWLKRSRYRDINTGSFQIFHLE
jgi:hypothetical protein